MAIGKTKGYNTVISKANGLYDSSIKMFMEAEQKIDEANQTLDGTIEQVDAAIKELEEVRARAVQDKERNETFKEKIKVFTAQ